MTFIKRSCGGRRLSRREMRTTRLLGVIFVLLAGFAAAAFFPLLSKSTRSAITRLWSRALLAVLGVRLDIEGGLAPGPMLVVANHVSWLDVAAINALRPCVFVCKSEVADWPAFGWLVARAGTIFMRRGSARSANEAMRKARARLREGSSVTVFPEGTSTDGGEVLPFSAAFFQAAIEAGCPVLPLALSYSSTAAVYAGATGFGESMLAIAGARRLTLKVRVLPALVGLENRRDAALQAHALIASELRSGTFPAEVGHALEPEGRLAAPQGSHHCLVQ
jgi:1-acyl-sn-glycerol-3-phosphate acyltransferase